MVDRWDICAIVVASYNSIMWIGNWVLIGYYIHHFWEDDHVYAGLLLMHVLLSNALQASVFGNISNMMVRDLAPSDSDYPDDCLIRRRALRRRPPFWSLQSEPLKEV